MERRRREVALLVLVGLAAAAGVLGLLGGGATARAATPLRPLEQAVQASGVITFGNGTCFPDALLLDCDGVPIRQLKGPGGSGYFAPYLNQWVRVSGSELTCVVGDKYINVTGIQTESRPCGTPGTPTAPPSPTGSPPPFPGGTPTATATAVVTGTGNLAFGKAMQASSAPDAAHPPAHAVDGDLNSWWASIPDPQPIYDMRHVQWIYVDLGADYQVKTMRMRWTDLRHPRFYQVMVWVERYRGWVWLAKTERGSADDSLEFPALVEGRYFMLWLEVPFTGGSHYELREWEIGGPATTPIQSTNQAAGKASLALSQETGFEAGRATDADLNTEWHSSGGLPVWLYTDLGANFQIDRVILRWTNGRHATSYSLYGWNGYNAWVPLYSTTRGNGGDELVTFQAMSTRYVLVYATAGPAGNVGLREFEVYERRASGGGGSFPRPLGGIAGASPGWVLAPTFDTAPKPRGETDAPLLPVRPPGYVGWALPDPTG